MGRATGACLSEKKSSLNFLDIYFACMVVLDQYVGSVGSAGSLVLDWVGWKASSQLGPFNGPAYYETK